MVDISSQALSKINIIEFTITGSKAMTMITKIKRQSHKLNEIKVETSKNLAIKVKNTTAWFMRNVMHKNLYHISHGQKIKHIFLLAV